MHQLLRNVLIDSLSLPAGPWIMKQTWHDLPSVILRLKANRPSSYKA